MAVITALFLLGILVFIHEMGHYLAARYFGMKIKTFSIGFGRPLWKRTSNRGETWQIGWLPFGGYVKIAGMDGDAIEEEGSFFQAPPLAKLIVALAGPLANIIAALLLFSFIFFAGGRVTSYGASNNLIGWVDNQANLEKVGIREGDRLISQDGWDITNKKEFLAAGLSDKEDALVEVESIDWKTQKTSIKTLSLPLYPHPLFKEEIKTTGMLLPASFLYYSPIKQPQFAKAQLRATALGFKPDDFIVWAQGHLLFSLPQMKEILNNNEILITIEREGKTLLLPVPVYAFGDLKTSPLFKGELKDWQYEARLNNRLELLKLIPYEISPENVIETPLESFSKKINNVSLKEGDKLLAINGKPVFSPQEVLKELQSRKVFVVVYRDPKGFSVNDLNIEDATHLMKKTHDFTHIEEALAPLYLKQSPSNSTFFLLPPIELLDQKKFLEDMGVSLPANTSSPKELVLGVLGITDLPIREQADPFSMAKDVAFDIGKTFSLLSDGSVSPKSMSGPIGIIQIVSDKASGNAVELAFWMGLISLNLALINLLPLPVLDGGTIVISLFEWISKRKVSPKTLEKIFIPFSLLLIFFMLFLTFNDIERWITQLLSK